MEEFAERIHSASPVTRYAAGSVITVLVLLIRIFAGNLWGSTLPLITLYPAVFIAAWLGGFGPGLLSCLICAAADDYLNVLPTYSFSTNHYGDMVALFLFVLIGTMMVAVVDSRAKSEAQLRAAQKVERDARAAAESANRTKDLLLAIVSHDLRNPLQGILGAVQVLGNLQLPREAQQFLPIIERNARTQARLLQDLMDLSRISAGYLSLSQNYETIRTIVEFTLDSMRPQFLEKKLNVEWTKTGGEKNSIR